MKKLFIFLVISVMTVFAGTGLAQAAIFVDFDTNPVIFAQDPATDVNHVISTVYGDISFNGRVYDMLDSDPYPDHTTGSGNFLKNTGANNLVTLEFDFDVESFDFYWLGVQGVTLNGAVYGAGDVLIEGGTETGTGAWQHIQVPQLSSPIRSISFWTETGNMAAIDDLTINPFVVTPEPASLSLLGLGLLGLLRRKR